MNPPALSGLTDDTGTKADEVAKTVSAGFESSTIAVESGRHVKPLNDAELYELRRKVQAKEVSIRSFNLQKEQAHRQQVKIHELELQLNCLRDFELELGEYEQHSVKSLRAELQTYQEEVAYLSKKLENAAKKREA